VRKIASLELNLVAKLVCIFLLCVWNFKGLWIGGRTYVKDLFPFVLEGMEIVSSMQHLLVGTTVNERSWSQLRIFQSLQIFKLVYWQQL